MRGKLTDTPLADIARRLSNDGVTGALEVTGDPGVARVFFRAGAVYWAMSPAPRARLGDRLVNAGFITQAQLDHTLEEQQGSDERTKLGALLVAKHLVGRDVIRVFVQEQILDALFDLVRWHEGDWVFHTGDAVDDKLPIDVPVSQLLVEVSRRQREWDQIQHTIPTLDAVPDHVIGGNATTAALEQDEFTMLASIDGGRSVRELAGDLGYSEFEAGRIVYGLTLLGIVEIVRDGDDETTEAGVDERAATPTAEATADADEAPTTAPDTDRDGDGEAGPEEGALDAALADVLAETEAMEETEQTAAPELDEPAHPGAAEDVAEPADPGVPEDVGEPADDPAADRTAPEPLGPADASPAAAEPRSPDDDIDVGEALEQALFGASEPEPDDELQVTVHFALDDDAAADVPDAGDERAPTSEPAPAGTETPADVRDAGDERAPTSEPAPAGTETASDEGVAADGWTPGDTAAGGDTGWDASAATSASDASSWSARRASAEVEDDDEPEPWVFRPEGFDEASAPETAEDTAADADVPAPVGEQLPDDWADAEPAFADPGATPVTEDASTAVDDLADLAGYFDDEAGADATGPGEDDDLVDDLAELAADIADDEATQRAEPSSATAEASPPPPPGSSAPGAPPAGAETQDTPADSPPRRSDVSEFLRELTQLASDDEEPAEPAADDEPERPEPSPPPAPRREPAKDDKDDKKKKGLFGWGR